MHLLYLRYQCFQSFFAQQLTKTEFQNYRKAYQNIIEEQVLISYCIKGISFEDTNNMTRVDRQMVFKALEHIREMEKEARDKAMKEAEAKR